MKARYPWAPSASAARRMSPGIAFQSTIGTQFNFVPYRGGAPAMQDLVGGQIDLMLVQAADAVAHVRAGRIKGYAVTAKTRMAAMPDLPSVDEAGLPGLHIAVWHGLWVPKGMPKDVIEELNAAVVDALADPSRAHAARRSRAGDFPARPADAGGARRAAIRLRSRSGGRLSERRGSRRSAGFLRPDLLRFGPKADMQIAAWRCCFRRRAGADFVGHALTSHARS